MLTCKRYIENIAEKYNCQSKGTVKVPLTDKLTAEDQSPSGSEVDPALYRSIVGSILYAPMTCRPDIAYTVKELSRFLTKPLTSHLNAAKRCIMYLHDSRELGLRYTSKGEQTNTFSMFQKRIWASKPVNKPLGYSDADWAGELPGRKSTSGWTFMLNGAAISWSSRTQSVVALSTTEAEYYALCDATKEALYVRKLLAELNDQDEYDEPMIIFEDNAVCAQWSKNEGLDHSRTKHIDIRYHMIRDNVRRHKIKVELCPTQEMVADVMTKNLLADLHQRTVLKMMGHKDIMSRPGEKLSGALIRDDPQSVVETHKTSANNEKATPAIKVVPT